MRPKCPTTGHEVLREDFSFRPKLGAPEPKAEIQTSLAATEPSEARVLRGLARNRSRKRSGAGQPTLQVRLSIQKRHGAPQLHLLGAEEDDAPQPVGR